MIAKLPAISCLKSRTLNINATEFTRSLLKLIYPVQMCEVHVTELVRSRCTPSGGTSERGSGGPRPAHAGAGEGGGHSAARGPRKGTGLLVLGSLETCLWGYGRRSVLRDQVLDSLDMYMLM